MFEDYEICAINDSLKKYEEANDPHGFIRFLSTTKRYSCSVIGQYFRAPKENVLSINTWKSAASHNHAYKTNIQLPPISTTDYYHGLAPAFTAETIKSAIKEGGFRNIETLLSFLEPYKSYYNWVFPHPVKEKDYPGLQEYYIYTVLKMASHFGYVFSFGGSSARDKVSDIISKNPGLFIEEVTYLWRDDKFVLVGGPTDSMLDALEGVLFTEALEITDKPVNGAFDFHDFYQHQGGADVFEPVMLGNASYYSGVIARLLAIDAPRTPEDGNNHIRVMRLLLGRTTFATLDAFDYGNIAMHPMLGSTLEGSDLAIRETIKAVRTAEYSRMKEVFDYDNSREGDKSHARTLLDILNRYLALSINSNTAAVSANLTSRDDCLIGAVRNSGSIDTGTCYCSANGQMEFRDKLVTFYRNSVYVDLPTMTVPKDDDYLFERLDFTKEIERETIAELNTSHFSATWKYYGMSVLGVVDRIGDGLGPTRLHFNVLTENSLLDNFIDVCEFRNEATESFENNRLIGFRPIKPSAIFSAVVSWIIDHGDFITNILLIILVLYERIKYGSRGEDILDTVLAFIFVLLEIIFISATVGHHLKQKRETMAKVKFVRHMVVKRKDLSLHSVEEKKDALSAELLSSVQALKERMNSLSSSYKSQPHSILVLMYMLNSITQTIDRT